MPLSLSILHHKADRRMNDRNLLLVPGLLCTSTLWRDQIAAFEGSFPIQVAEHHLDNNMPGIARRILDKAPETFSLAGLSMGGYIAFEIWRQAPERVERMALLDTRATKDTPEETQRRKDLLALADKGRFTGISERLMPLFISSRPPERHGADGCHCPDGRRYGERMASSGRQGH